MRELPKDTRPLVMRGHVIDMLRELPEKSVQCGFTSPPYLWKRDYSICECSASFGDDVTSAIGGPTEKNYRHKDPDPNCPNCHGTGRIPGMEQVWGGEPTCQHVFDVPGRDQAHRRGNRSGDFSTSSLTNPARQDSVPRPDNAGVFCSRCRAWLGMLGQEPTPKLYADHLVAVFREVRRVLRDTGVFFINIGDTYAGEDGNGLKDGDLIGVPWTVAFALRDDGWYVRSRCLWIKKAPMTEGVTNRPTVAEEEIFMLTKRPSGEYFYDNNGIREEPSEITAKEVDEEYTGEGVKEYAAAGVQNPSDVKRRTIAGLRRRRDAGLSIGANLRTTWILGPDPYHGGHYATFTRELPRRGILLGTSEKGGCATCGAPWERLSERHVTPAPDRIHVNQFKHAEGTNHGEGQTTMRAIVSHQTLGWVPTCQCGTPETLPDVVLDIFAGTGRTLEVARMLGRRSVGIDVNPVYIEIIESKPEVSSPSIETVWG